MQLFEAVLIQALLLRCGHGGGLPRVSMA